MSEEKNVIGSNIVTGIRQEYIGKRLQVLSEIQIYLSQPVGIGEHSNIVKEVKNKLQELKDIEDMIAIVEKHYSGTPTEKSNE